MSPLSHKGLTRRIPHLKSEQVYWQRVKNIAPANLLGLWRLNETSGTDALDSSGNDYDGTYSGVTLAALTGPDGSPAPSFDGLNDYADLSASGAAAVFNGNALTLNFWFKVANIGVWSDSTNRVLFMVYDSVSSEIFYLRKQNTGDLQWVFNAGTAKTISKAGVTSTGWISMGVTIASGTMIAYFNGAPEGSPLSGLDTWTSTPEFILVGANSVYGANWPGGISLPMLWDTAFTSDQMAEIGAI